MLAPTPTQAETQPQEDQPSPKALHDHADYAAFVQHAAQAGEDATYELIWGEIAQKPMPTQLHAEIAVIISAHIWFYLKSKPIGRVFAEANYRLPSDPMNDRIPDVSFVRADRNLPLVEAGSAPYMPDLAVEIKSEGNSYRELREKAGYFLRGGARLVWLVYPNVREVEVCTMGEAGQMSIVRLTGEGAVLSGGDVLPEFSLPLREIFPPLPTPPAPPADPVPPATEGADTP
ncbi:MAG: Uma2 family endonuclease [Anaerolineae bacterium]|nr:Uma2 family endonuclease [Anaerolineae bacterium]